MPRSIWSGAISFGLVNVPVKVYSAVSSKTVRFNQLNGKTGTRIAQKRVDPESGEEVPYEDLVKGYEVSKGRYVVISPEELDSIAPEKTRSIEIEDFVELAEIDPVYYDHPYWLVPATGAAKPYALLLAAMRESGKVAIARVVLRNKEHLVALRPAGRGLMMETMNFHDEVVADTELEELTGLDEGKASEREVAMARSLIDSLTREFDPAAYTDTYRDQVLELVERKASGEEIALQPEPAADTKVPDLMAALEASLAAVSSDGGDGKRRAARAKAPAEEPAATKS